MKLARKKKQRRKEGEEEREANEPSVAEVRASLDRKIEEIGRRKLYERREEWKRLSELTRRAWRLYERLKERDIGVGDPDYGARLLPDW